MFQIINLKTSENEVKMSIIILSSRFREFCKSAQIRKLHENINATGLSKKDISRDCNKEIQQDFYAV